MRQIISVTLAVFSLSNLSFAEVESDLIARGAHDHDFISRYTGSTMYSYSMKDFDSYPLVKGPIEKNQSNFAFEEVEGKVVQIGYNAPANTSPLQILKNYEKALVQAGFKIDLKATTLDSSLAHQLDDRHAVPDWCFCNEEKLARYYLRAKRQAANQITWVAFFVTPTRNSDFCKADVHYIVDVITSKPLDTTKVQITAAEIEKQISSEGNAKIHGVLFATDSDQLNPAGTAAVKEIATVLKNSPTLKLYVVGHTDTTGNFEHNIDLSERRAVSVVKALTQTHLINSSRLKGHGVGPLAPVATNATDEGRAQNRRVELVRF